MRHTASEKSAISELVEASNVSVRQTLRELQISSSTYYSWYARFLKHGASGLASRASVANTFWNRIPQAARERVRDVALEPPEFSPRELACRVTDREGWFVSESSVYRILRSYDLIPSPQHILISAGKKFQHPTHAVNELRQTDFIYFEIKGWGSITSAP